MITTNNNLINLVTKSARRATRIVCSGERTMHYMKRYIHRKHRREIKQRLNNLYDYDELDNQPSQICTSREIC
jgi:hypothetical protein